MRVDNSEISQRMKRMKHFHLLKTHSNKYVTGESCLMNGTLIHSELSCKKIC